MVDKMVEKVARLMKEPGKIRNVGVCAHIDHGKCVSGDTKVLLADGTFGDAKDIYSEYERSGKIVKDGIERVVDIRNLNIKVPSFNRETNKIESRRINFLWKIKTTDNIINVKFSDGKIIKVTPEHKFLVVNQDYEVIEKRGYELNENDFILCPRRIEYKKINLDELERTVLEKLAKDKGFIVYLDKKFGEKLHKNIIEYNRKKLWKEIKSPLKFLSFYHCVWKKRYRLCDLVKISNLFNIGFLELYQNIECFNYRNSFRKEFKNSVKIRLPKTYNQWKDFFYLLGIFWGDGSVNVTIDNMDKEIQNEVFRICKSIFGIVPSLKIYGNKCPRIYPKTGLTFVEILKQLFDYPLKQKSRNIIIPKIIQRLPKDILFEFLRGYFDTGGSVGVRHPVSISSSSERMIRDLQLVLLKYGCTSLIYKKLVNKKFEEWILVISGKISLERFSEEIGFKLKYKKDRLATYLTKCELSIRTDYLPYPIGDLSGGKRGIPILNCELECSGLLKELITGNLFLNKVVNVKDVENEEYVYDFSVDGTKNFIAEGLIIHNTTFSDNLLAGAGMISEEMAGKQLALDFHEDEQTRGITIDAANVSMVHDLEGEEYLINLIDTPGHVDFGGDVTRAMRAVDGVIVLCCAVEGVMPQTETVLRQALKERVKPILFINKVDRLIREVKLTPEQMQERFVKIIQNVNKFIRDIAPEEYKEKWQVSIEDGSVAFGSAFHKWALSLPFLKKTNTSFKEVIDAYEKETYKELAKKVPLHRVILHMVIKHHPNPVEAQKYRVPKIWHGDLESEEGMSLINCDPNGPAAFVVTKIVIDKHAGEVAAGRLFSGTMVQGQDVYLNMAKKEVRLQQVSVYKGAQRVTIESAPAGNIIGLVGLKNTFAGETVSSKPMEPFEALKHLFEPVVTKSVEAKSPADLPRLIEVLKQVNKEDPTIFIEINEETGENIMMGMGELHLEIIENRIKTNKGLDIITGNPIVVYRETVTRTSPEVEGKSPNKHNKFYVVVEPLEDEIYKAIKNGELPELRISKKDVGTYNKLVELGVPMKEAKKFREIYKGNVIIDGTRGVVHIGEVIELVMDAFEQVMNGGSLAREPCMKLKVILNDTKLHEDAIHRGPAQVYPAVRDAIRGAMAATGTVMFEPVQIIQIEAPIENMGDLSKLIQNKRGQLISMDQEGEHITIKAKMPVAEMIGLSSDLRSATGGRGNYYVIDQIFEKLPDVLKTKVINQIRERKGLSVE